LKAESSYRKKIVLLAKLVLVPVTFGFIFYKLFYAYHITSLWQQVQITWNTDRVIALLAVVVLMLVNWGIESAKWKLLVQRTEFITNKQAAQAVLSGIALNIITPNQLGDFVGRVMHLKKLDKVRGTLLTVIGHTAQVIMTAAFGLFALIWFALSQAKIAISTADWLFLTVSILSLLSMAAYLNISILAKLPLANKYRHFLDVFRMYTRSELVQVLLFSFLRYVIFVIQYVLLMQVFKVDVSIVNAIACIIAVMFVQSFVPSFILVDVGMRGASALWFFSFFTPAVAPVLLTAYSLWMINLMLPGLLGLYFILKWKKEVEA
jgi:hypothetical protein